MNFKLFLKDKLSYIIIYYFSIILVITIMVLDLVIRSETINFSNVLYALLLSTLLLGLFLVFNYIKSTKFYNSIDNKMESDESFQYMFNIPDNISNEYNFIKDILSRDYQTYITTLDKYKKNSKTQIDFNNRWIHEMKTPVSVIKLILENEKDKIADNETKRSYESIEEEMEKLSNGLEMALHMLRINDFELDFKVEEISLLDIVHTVINENKSTFIANSIYPKAKLEEDLIIKSDKKWIKFIIGQIISNSIKYSKVKNDFRSEIIIESFIVDGNTILSIKDKGVGIPNSDLERIFNPFFTGVNGRKYLESTGMGLYLCKHVCDRLGHKIDIQSVEGEGTTVNIVFYKEKSIYNLQV